MQAAAINSEEQTLLALAEEWRARGYEVLVQPELDQLPDRVAGFRPDLVVRKDDEVRVIEVTSRTALRRDARLQALAEAVRAQPNWRFEVVVADPAYPQPMPADMRSWDCDEVEARLCEARKLLETGHEEAALLLAWSAIEAALRIRAEREGLMLEQLQPPYVLKRLVTEGILSRADFSDLWAKMELRNAIAHGHRPAALNRDQVHALLVRAHDILELGEVTGDEAVLGEPGSVAP